MAMAAAAAALSVTPNSPARSRSGPHSPPFPAPRRKPLFGADRRSRPSRASLFSARASCSSLIQFPPAGTAPLELKPSDPDRFPIKKILLCGLVSSSVCCLACRAALAAADSIRASGVGLKVAAALRGLGWPDEAVVFTLATLPVLELRGAIPVGYWMQLSPLRLTVLSVLGNMVPVPIIVLYLKKLALFVSRNNASGTSFLDRFFQKAREKAGPVEEFQWLGLMLFVAVPFPGTGAWTGAIIASILDMPFWSAVSANFFGVVVAGLLVNLLVNLGIKHAVAVGLLLFLVSTVMWSVLRWFKKALSPN